jgi:uncharacterized protein YlaI
MQKAHDWYLNWCPQCHKRVKFVRLVDNYFCPECDWEGDKPKTKLGGVDYECPECWSRVEKFWDNEAQQGEHDPEEQKPGGSTPSQYSLPSTATELQDLIEFRQMNFQVGNIFKAAYRMGHCEHSDPLRDARKIKFFAEREINRLEKKRDK